jgi:cell volume regulation protein A
VNRQLVELGLPHGALVIFIERNNEYIVPGGGTVLKAGDRLHLLADRAVIKEVRSQLERQAEAVS